MKRLPTINWNTIPMGLCPHAAWRRVYDHHQASISSLIHAEVWPAQDKKGWEVKVFDPAGGESLERFGILDLRAAKIVAEVMAAKIAKKLGTRLLQFYDLRARGVRT